MPLWSNEQWRACIGSCWCALGRPFNTRFTRNRGKSRGMLTLHQVATMVIMMMLLIAANLGLAATQGHHKIFMSTLLFGDVIMELHAFRLGLISILFIPIVKMCVQMVYHLLPRQTRTSLGQFYVDMTHSLRLIRHLVWIITSPAMYVMNSMTSGVSHLLRAITEPSAKWTQNEDMLSQGSVMRSLVVVIMLAIQLLVTASVARSIIFFLLLTSGDVEQNPGPCQTEGFLPTTAILDIALLLSQLNSQVEKYIDLKVGRWTFKAAAVVNLVIALLISRLFICWRQIRVKALWTSLVFSRNSLFYPVSSPFQHKAGTGVVMMVVLLLLSASTVNSSLLLKSGDVEQNPGPSYLDATPKLHELERINVNGKTLKIMDRVAVKWEIVATRLHFEAYDIVRLRRDSPYQSIQACRSVFTEWLEGKGRQPRTWATLIEVLKEAELSILAHELEYIFATKPDYEHELNLLLEKEGYVELTTSKILITGAAGSGKTCTKHILYKLPPPGERVSTELLEEMDRAYVAREIDHDLAYFTPTESESEYDWIIVHSDSHIQRIELYSMLAATVSDERDIGYPRKVRKVDNSPTDYGQNEPAPSYDSPDVMQTSQHQPTVSSNGKKLLLEKMNDPRNVGNCIHQVHWIHFLDSGGQSAFHDILPAFVHNISVVIFVLKLSEAMDKQPFDDYYEGDKPIGDSKRSPYQVKEILKSIIQSMCSSKNCGKLLIIGTHFDKVLPDSEEPVEAKDDILKSLLNSSELNMLDVLCRGNIDKGEIMFLLNAKDQDDESKKGAKAIRESIVKNGGYIKQKIPISWFLLEEDLRMKCLGRKHGILNKTECQPIADSLKIKNLSAALEYFNSLNIFLYFPNSQRPGRLSNLVFTKPQVVVTIISIFVKKAYKLRDEGAKNKLCNSYVKTGQFTVDFIQQEKEIIDDFIDNEVGFEITEMIELLCITFVIAPINESKYFIPCILECCPPDEIRKEISTQCVAPMVIKLPGECVPRGFFCGLVCSLLSRWKLHCTGGKLAEVFKNFIRFDIEKEGYNIAIVDAFFYISIHVFGKCGRKGCNKIQSLVRASVKEIIAQHNYENNVLPDDDILFLCPCGKVPEHFAQVIAEESLDHPDQEFLQLKCAMYEKQTLDLTQGHVVWFSDERYAKWSKQTQGTVVQRSQVHNQYEGLPVVESPQRTVEEVIASIPGASRWKLDKEIDFENVNDQGEPIPRHIGIIATAMIHWEGCVADELGLTQPERVDIVQGRYARDPGMQRREVLNKWKQKLSHNATYKALIEAFVKADRLDCADTVCRCTLMESPSVKAKCAMSFSLGMSEDDFFKWLTTKGLSERDSRTMKEYGITALIFKELNSDDLNELKKGLTFGGERHIEKLHKEANQCSSA